jgi:hypothetical protein
MLKEFVSEKRRRATKALTVMLSNAGAQISSRIIRRLPSEFVLNPLLSFGKSKTDTSNEERTFARAHKYKSRTEDDCRKVKHFSEIYTKTQV